MNSVTLIVITIVVLAIILVEFNKQQKIKISDNTQSNAYLQELYLLKAAEYKIGFLKNQHINAPDLAEQFAQTTQAFEKGDLPLKEFNLILDNLLSKVENSKIKFA